MPALLPASSIATASCELSTSTSVTMVPPPAGVCVMPPRVASSAPSWSAHIATVCVAAPGVISCVSTAPLACTMLSPAMNASVESASLVSVTGALIVSRSFVPAPSLAW